MPEKHDFAFCTYFDSGYLNRGLSLIDSIRSFADLSPVVVLALDERVIQFFVQFPQENVQVISLSELETYEPRLLDVKDGRSKMEYFFTTTPIFTKYVLEKYCNSNGITAYVDADLYFFDHPSAVVDAMENASVGIIPHRYPPKLSSKLSKYGTYNVGWVGFRKDSKGLEVLNWYCEQTIDWCYDKPENGKYADQGYLDSFHKFDGVAVLDSAGLNLAPWNTSSHRLKELESKVSCDGKPLVFFHFHGIKSNKQRFITSQLVYRSPMNKVLRHKVYIPYLKVLNEFDNKLAQQGFDPQNSAPRGNGLKGMLFRSYKILLTFVSTATGNTVNKKLFRVERH